jgi:release factor glutamine methyltransferase
MGLFLSNKIPDAIHKAAKILSEAGVELPEVEAQSLAAHILSTTRLELLAASHRLAFTFEQLEIYEDYIRRRAVGEPIAYIINQTRFLDHTLHVDPRVLIPRPDTELLFETAATLFHPDKGSWMDVGTGAGAIAIAAAARFPQANVIATDLSQDAIKVAKRNAGNFSNITFYQSNLLNDLPPLLPPPYLITANLPYIPTGAISGLAPHVRQEPHMALDGGIDGLVLIRSLITQAAQRHIPVLALEIGDGQDQVVIDFLKQHGYHTRHRLPYVDGPIRVITAEHTDTILQHG